MSKVDLGAVSAYAIAVECGFEGTKEEWLESLKGEKGESGEQGKDGVTPIFSMGMVTTLSPGSSATASVTGTAEKPVLNLGIPRGADGEGAVNTVSDNVKPLTENWMSENGSAYVLNATNSLNDTYWVEEYDARIPGAVAELYAKFDTLVTAGYCKKTELTTVTAASGDYKVYAYEFTTYNDWIGGEETYGINSVTDASGRLYNKPKILLTSGVHGNERMTPVCMYEFAKRLCTDSRYQKMRSAFDFYMIPIVNPTGIESDVRRNYQNIDINRDTVNKATLEMAALQTYVNAKTNSGVNKFLYAIDFHQAPSNDNYMTAFMSLPVGVVDDFVYGRFVSFGQEALNDVREYLNFEDTTSQRLYPWKGQEGDTIRNYLGAYATYSMCWECSHYEKVYTNSTVRNNEVASLIHNSIFDATCRALFDPTLVGVKYNAAATVAEDDTTGGTTDDTTETNPDALTPVRTFEAYIKASGLIDESTTGKQIPVYKVSPNMTYTIIANSDESNPIYGGVLAEDTGAVGITLKGIINETAMTSSKSLKYTVPEGMNYLYLYHKGACEPETGLGFTVVAG